MGFQKESERRSGDRLALAAAGENKAWKQKTAKAQNKTPKRAESPSRPLHAVLDSILLCLEIPSDAIGIRYVFLAVMLLQILFFTQGLAVEQPDACNCVNQ
jgi:hypothetical protein